MNRSGARGQPCRNVALRMYPASLRTPVHEDGKCGGRHALLHPLDPRLRKTSPPKYIPQEPPIYRIIRLGKIHLPQESQGAVTAPCGDYLLGHHYTIGHLSARQEGGLEGAYKCWEDQTKPVGQHLRDDQINGVQQRYRPEVPNELRPLDFR